MNKPRYHLNGQLTSNTVCYWINVAIQTFPFASVRIAIIKSLASLLAENIALLGKVMFLAHPPPTSWVTRIVGRVWNAFDLTRRSVKILLTYPATILSTALILTGQWHAVHLAFRQHKVPWPADSGTSQTVAEVLLGGGALDLAIWEAEIAILTHAVTIRVTLVVFAADAVCVAIPSVEIFCTLDTETELDLTPASETGVPSRTRKGLSQRE